MLPSGNLTAREQILQRYVRQILDVGQPQAIVLFGSGARGEATGDSDFDLLVVEDTPFRQPNGPFRIAWPSTPATCQSTCGCARRRRSSVQ